MSKINVAVGIIFNKQEEVLITQRSEFSSCPSLWEFPGGKIEPNETSDQALIRELKEEVEITCFEPEFWQKYCGENVNLHVFIVRNFSGTARCAEAQQALKWAKIGELNQFIFPSTNDFILSNIPNLLQYASNLC